MPLASVISNLVRFGIQLGLFVLVYVYYAIIGQAPCPNLYLLLFPVLLVMMAGLALGFGIIISSMTTKYRDLTILFSFFVSLWMYATPFMNKTIEGLYPPGSTFKIVVALAALESGAITPKEKIFCRGYWEYGNHKYHCWEKKGHGWVDLAGALKHSCDVYFYQVALRIGIDAIKQMALKLGLNQKYMDDVLAHEMTGVIPDRYWKEQNIGSSWVHGDTVISGIGQGFILTNCLQLAVMMARVASNKQVVPHLIYNNSNCGFADLGIQEKNLKFVLNGLEQVTQKGGTASGSAINVNGKKMGGKTGTSQVRNISKSEREKGVLTNEQLQWNLRNHGLFVGYAPTKSPKYAVCIIMEHAGGSGPAARATARIMKELLK